VSLTFFRAGRAAITFLTRIPVGGFPYGEREWQWTGAWFPAVGAALGALYAGVFAAAAPLGPFVQAVLVLSAALLVTGAFHEDGLADTADALGGAYTQEKLFEILKDSRIGAFGAAALIVSLLLRTALLVRLGPAAPAALVLAEAVSRWPPVVLMAIMPYATPRTDARSRAVVSARAPQAVVATLSAVGLVVAATSAQVLPVATAGAVLLAPAALAAVCAWRFHVRAGGITGDFLGATQQVGVSATLAALAGGSFTWSPW
jgi:adenosylcobinamide-GDP ribazoletransferase